MQSDDVYASPRTATDVNACYFYHTMDVPGVGRVTGEWAGFLSFHMEGEGADVAGYAVPAAIGPVDIATFGSVLLHVRDPFLALQNALRLTRETVIVTEPLWRRLALVGRLVRPPPAFRPDPRTAEPRDTWWTLTPDVVKAFIGVLGFEDAQVRYHVQTAGGRRQRMFTVVGRRTHGSL